MKRIIVAGLAAAVFTGTAFCQQMQQPMHHEMPKPTNLQVLPKNISSADLMKLMHGYAGQLNVKCSFCHAEDKQTHHINFASDANPEKKIARTMIAMTGEINEKYLSQVKDPDGPMKVECGTCHRGHSMPQAYVPPPEAEHHGH